jgi:SAM-dependent methyltransferase
VVDNLLAHNTTTNMTTEQTSTPSSDRNHRLRLQLRRIATLQWSALLTRETAHRLPAKLLFVYQRYTKSTYVLITLLSAVFAKFLFAAIAGNLSSPLTSNTAQNVAAAIVALPVVPLLRYFAMHKDIALVMSIGAEAGAPNKGPILSFLTESLDEMKTQLGSLQEGGALLDPYKVAQWVRHCFEGTESTSYFGTDSHKPSEYGEVYADYLRAHESYINRIIKQHHDFPLCKRILVNSVTPLRTDRSKNVKPNQDFADWHDRNHVSLWQIDTHDNRTLLETHKLHDLLDTDIAYWANQYVLLFNPLNAQTGLPHEDGRIGLRVAFKGDVLYTKCARYVQLLENGNINALDKDLPFYPKALSDNWKRFALPDERLHQTGPLIEGVVARLGKPKSDVWILDAATGVGFETVYLLKEGYFVQANEIEASLRDAADRYAREQGTPIPGAQFSSSDWLELDQGHQAGQYDIVLVLGNSLCHLDTTEQVTVALGQFHKVLKPGGFLVCDERNFAKILADWDTIALDPLNNFSYNNDPDRVMYRGSEVLGAPFHRDGKRVIFDYWETKRAAGKFQPIKKLGSLSMFAFDRGFLLSSLTRAGFAEIETLCDLKPCGDNTDVKMQADFLTYIARR